MKDDHPKFYCEYCGCEVKRNAKICPHCGRFFANIRCPACGFTGKETDFVTGCPQCGYAVHTDLQHERVQHVKEKPNRNVDERLPMWVYATAIGLLGLFIFLTVLSVLK